MLMYNKEKEKILESQNLSDFRYRKVVVHFRNLSSSVKHIVNSTFKFLRCESIPIPFTIPTSNFK